MCWTYILYSASADRFYVGSTGNIADRIRRHNQGRSKYTKFGRPWVLVFSKIFDSKSEAYQFELLIKSKKSREFILELTKNWTNSENLDIS